MAEGPLTSDARTRAADLYAAHAHHVARRLAARFPGTDPQTVSDAVVRAVLLLTARFEQYDPEQASPRSYLYGFARRALAGLRRSEQRRRRREKEKAIDPVTTSSPCGQPVLEALADRELAEQVRASLRLNPEDERVLDLWLQGEKDTGVYAAGMGLAGRPPEEQAEAVGRALNRLRQRLHRARLRLRQEGETR
jgi:RNA polymerase sigma-70 factor (ECF subfamily)